MESKIIQITSGQGPDECCRAVLKIQQRIIHQAETMKIHTEIIDTVKGDLEGTLRSVTIQVQGDNLASLISEWNGTICWIAQSPYRKFHKRRNWYVGIYISTPEKAIEWDIRDIVFETLRSSGPGGQNVNKVETAVRGIHQPTGIQVLVTDTRSQLQNKKLCIERLEFIIKNKKVEAQVARQKTDWSHHAELIRGRPVKTIIEKL